MLSHSREAGTIAVITFRTDKTARLARPVAAEDLRLGDMVAVLNEIVEYPSFFWGCDSPLMDAQQVIRIQYRAFDGGLPLKVKAICLPYVFVRTPAQASYRRLDVRQCQLVRLSPHYARRVWKLLRKQCVGAKRSL